MSTLENLPALGTADSSGTTNVDVADHGVNGGSSSCEEMPPTRPSHEPLTGAKPKQHHLHRRNNRHPRSMGHYPPRAGDNNLNNTSPDETEESRQDSLARPARQLSSSALNPPTSLAELSTQLEETLEETIKPALQNFFYPPVSAERAAGLPERHSSHHRRRLHEQAPPTAAASMAPLQRPPVIEKGPEIHQQQERQKRPPASAEVGHPNNIHHDHQDQPSNDADDNVAAYQQDFDSEFEVQAEADRKYVERFWTVYDDIIILSLFTQIGVIFRLMVSTWFTYFDGVFRPDSPLCTTLPLNCLSCFLMGLLGSGDRLMEMITTRFTPRKLQAQIKAEEKNNDGDDDEYDDGDHNDSHRNPSYDNQRQNTRRRRRPLDEQPRKRRGKRNKGPAKAKDMDEVFHSWQPPIHWHDDLREVQLLALERRIRASKCLILFSVKKQEADLMEHYFDSASPVTRHRPRPDGNSNNGFEYDNDDGDDRDYGYNDQEGIGYADEGGRLSFDLELAESTDKGGDNTPTHKEIHSPGIAELSTALRRGSQQAALSPSSAGNLPPSVAKLIKRSPGVGTTPPSSPPRSPDNAPPAAKTQHPANVPESNIQCQANPSSPAPQSPTLPLSSTGDSNYCRISIGQTPSSVQVAVAGAPVSPAATDQPLSTVAAPTDSQAGLEQDQCSVLTEENDQNLDQIISSVRANVSENVNRIRRVNLANGWDMGTTPEAMADDLMLGLRDGFCGALSSFSSWNSAMLILIREGHIGEAFVGYMLGIQLPIVAYRFGQQVAVYYFVWRCRRESKRDERRGYGLRLSMDDGSLSERVGGNQANARLRTSSEGSGEDFEDELSRENSMESIQDDYTRDVPSVRAVCTALFMLSLVSLFTALFFFYEPEDQQVSLSLLFSPLGSMARWRLSQFNSWRPGFPVGTFACNILACALSGSLGSLLAGNPGPRERTVLVSLIAGFGGTLSSLATFIVEILAGVDPLLFRFDGFIYAIGSVFWAMVVGFIFEASMEWQDDTTQALSVNGTRI